jgi:hypothetical protein
MSCVVRKSRQRLVEAEALCTLERIESCLLSAIQRFLSDVRKTGVWGDDCEQLAAFIENPADHVRTARDALAHKAATADSHDPMPAAVRARLNGGQLFDAFSPGSVRFKAEQTTPCQPSLPLFCPRCGAILAIWEARQSEQTCRLCGFNIRVN